MNQIAEIALFNVPLDDYLLQTKCSDTDETISESMVSSVYQSLKQSVHPALLLSAGYDSRLLLAAAKKCNRKLTGVTWATPNPTVETAIARKLCDEHGMRHVVIDTEALSIDDLRSALVLFAQRTKGRLSVSRAPVFEALRRLGNEFDLLIWGEGEIFRPPLIPSEYITAHALALLAPERFRMSSVLSGLFSPDLPYASCEKQAMQNFAYLHSLPFHERLAQWLIRVAYPGIYTVTAKAISKDITVVLPFLDRNVIEATLRSGRSVACMKDWKQSVRNTLDSRRTYYDLISELSPDLLHIRTDRGYPPAWDRDIRSIAMTSLYGMKNLLKPKQRRGLFRIKYQKALRDEIRDRLPSPIADQDLAMQLLRDKRPWSTTAEYNAGKLLAVLVNYE